jgi:acyl-CoA thioester hydrolase
VNNAVYLNYLEAARWKFFKEVDMLDYMMDKRIYPVVIETNIKYVRELKLFEQIVVKSKWEIEDNYIIANQNIVLMNGGGKSAKAKVKMLLISEERLICDIPNKLKDNILGQNNSENNGSNL